MNKVLIFLFLFYSTNVYANLQYSSSEQASNRCSIGIGLDLNKSCVDGLSAIPLPSDHHVIGIDYQYQAPNTALDVAKINYFIKYAYCDAKNSKYINDDCKTTTRSQGIQLDSNNIADSLDQCLKYPQYIQNINDSYFNGRVCLVRMLQNQAIKYMNKITDIISYVCAFNILDENKIPYTDINEFNCLGCQLYPQFNGPPPFLPGIMPYISFSVPEIKTYQGFNSDTTFQAPVATISKAAGSKLLPGISIGVDLSMATNGSVSKCITDQNNNTNCVSMIYYNPDLLTIKQNGIVLGDYPRPAIEQKSNTHLSFFPCYHTYKKPNTSKVYQGVFVFSINRGPQEAIGIDKNDTTGDGKIYLGTNYIPVLSDKITPANCDLCFNASTQVSEWDENIYKNLPIQNGCTLDPDILITKVHLYNQDDFSEFSYSLDNTCQQSTEVQIEAPLRVNMFDKDEQDILNMCDNNIIGIQYGYTSDKAILDKYLVKIQPIIPELDNNGEAAAEILVSALGTGGCYGYSINSINGLPFIKGGGLRDRSFCVKPIDAKPEDVYTLCSNANNTAINQVACPGLYQGSKELSIIKDSQNINATTRDKICIMTGDNWDFISGRYQTSYKTNLNQDKKVIPRMSCTNLPDCTSLGTETITNIGNAVWNDTAKFNELLNGECNENAGYYYRRLGLLNTTASFYTIDPAVITDTTSKTNLDIALSQIKEQMIKDQNNNDMPYLTEQYLKANSDTLYQAYIDNNKNLFICPSKILPRGTCIGGIYAIDKDLLSSSQNINPNSRTGCVIIADSDTPVQCKE